MELIWVSKENFRIMFTQWEILEVGIQRNSDTVTHVYTIFNLLFFYTLK